jgi:hypothetical protein
MHKLMHFTAKHAQTMQVYCMQPDGTRNYSTAIKPTAATYSTPSIYWMIQQINNMLNEAEQMAQWQAPWYYACWLVES